MLSSGHVHVDVVGRECLELFDVHGEVPWLVR